MINQRKYKALVSEALNSLDIPVGQPNSLHFTFILRRNHILSIGYNNIFKGYPKARHIGYWEGVVHSEFDAIRRFPLPPEKLADCELVNIRSNRHGEIRNAEPCKICRRMIFPFGLRNIYYSITNTEFAKW